MHTNTINNDSQFNREFLRIVSWNVAGWTATANIIRTLYDGKISAFLNNFHGSSSQRPIDIFALQEVKGTGGIKKLRQDPVGTGACDSSKSGLTIPGWDTFWAHSEPQFKGFNGVAIFARTGLVVAADPAPLRVAELDAEGRCILAVTESCSVFSVYAPASRGAGRTELRRRFFSALGDAVERVRRDYGKPVVLCGDLNATYRASDCHWSWRRFSFEKLKMNEGDEFVVSASRQEGRQDNDKILEEQEEKEKMIVHWPRWMNEQTRKLLIKDVEDHVEVLKKEKEKSLLQKTSNCNDDIINATKFAVKNPSLNNNNSGENCFPRTSNDDNNNNDKSNNDNINDEHGNNDDDDALSKKDANNIPSGEENKGNDKDDHHDDEVDDEHWWIDTFCNVDLTAWKSRRWYPVSQLGYLVGDEFAFARSVLKHTHCDGQGNLNFLFSKGLVDSLTTVHPDISDNKNLYTCFNQSRNERFTGVGQRIDYVFVDPELLVVGSKEPETGEQNNLAFRNNADDNMNPPQLLQQQQQQQQQAPQTEFHSSLNGHDWMRLLRAASSNGTFAPAPTDGGGLAKLNLQGCEKSFLAVLPEKVNKISVNSNAGVIYTAPQLSDHVAVFCDVIRQQGKREIAMSVRVDDDDDSESLLSKQQAKNIEELQNGATKTCKYTSTMRSISSFFSSSTTSSNVSGKSNNNSQQQSFSSLPQRRERKEQKEIEVIELD